ncbi:MULTISPECIES: MFS transporter [unclassified Dietzia]|uniref:MFS transporter n=3 Tax=Dietzia TaxID=37914 RepID=UPI000D2195C4|nr:MULTISPECIES: MFS transporter [unclassified Dietzia]AVZ38762.1 MFS transporter [Dietzia sp. JS16-p6b]QGW23865.1 MFS transporter [Dietzia sp. DQ12-45-1b]
MGDRSPGPARRAAARIGRGVRRVFHADGANRSGLSQLSYVTVANFACDAILAVALANTLFFSAATAESRSNVALYLLVTVAPFAVIAPVIGPALDRLRSGRRLTVSLTFTLRAVLAVILALNFDSWLLYPLALGMLVLSKTFGVVKASITPHVLPPALDLVRTNSRLTVLGHVCGSLIAGALAGAVSWLWGSDAALWLLAVVALVSAYVAMTIPARAEASLDEESATLRMDRGRPLVSGLKAVLTRPLGRQVLANLWAVSMVRLMTGFLTLFLAFVAKAQENATAAEQAGMLAIAGVAGGLGTFAGNAVGARLPLGRPGRITTTAAGAALSAAVVAAVLGSIWAAAPLALVAAVSSALGKVALDASIQTDIPDSARSSAFGRSETALQLAWVAGGALGVLLPPDFTVGFGVIAVVGALLFAQSLLTARGSTLVPGLGGNRPRFPGEPRDPRSFGARLLGRMEE